MKQQRFSTEQIGPGHPHTVDTRSIGDILINRLRIRIRFLENYADPGAQPGYIDFGRIDVYAVDFDPASHSCPGYCVVHPVDAPQESALAATRWTDEGSHQILWNIEINVPERLLFP